VASSQPTGSAIGTWHDASSLSLSLPLPLSPSVTTLMTVEQAIEADRQWFAAHPEADEYIREFVPGEFGALELPQIPPGYRYGTLVSVIHRTEGTGVADGRYRSLVALCDNAASRGAGGEREPA
jgi:hypothetical protein